MHHRGVLHIAAAIALLATACGGGQVQALVVPGTAKDLGISPKGLMGATYSLVAAGGGFRVLMVSGERMELAQYDPEGKREGAEILLNLQPELWAVDEDLLASAIMSPRMEDLPEMQLEACLRTGLSEIARHVFVYGQGLVPVGDGYGVVFGARTSLECEEAGSPSEVSVEHVIVFDADFNRTQHDRFLWIDGVPMDAILDVGGPSIRAAWLVSDGVFAGGGGLDMTRAVNFTDPWRPSDMPVHFFEPTPGSTAMFALGVVERPMATVGQGESYLVMHMAGRADPSSLEVSRLALPEHPQAAAAAWKGGRLGVTLFAEVRPPHAECRVHAYYVEYDPSGQAAGELSEIMEWKSATGKTFGMMELEMACGGETCASAILYNQGMGGMIELITVTSGSAGPPATHDMGWENAKDLRIESSGEDFLILWSDKVVRVLEVGPPYGVGAAP